jgi:hypothetical protein
MLAKLLYYRIFWVFIITTTFIIPNAKAQATKKNVSNTTISDINDPKLTKIFEYDRLHLRERLSTIIMYNFSLAHGITDPITEYNMLNSIISASYPNGKTYLKSLPTKYHHLAKIPQQTVQQGIVNEEIKSIINNDAINTLLGAGYSVNIIEQFYRNKQINIIEQALDRNSDLRTLFFSDAIIIGKVDSVYQDYTIQDGFSLSFIIHVKELLKEIVQNLVEIRPKSI